MKIAFAILFAASLFANSALAAVPDHFSDPVQETRARALQKELRCLVCQGESLDESEAPLAADLRTLVREHMAAGESDDDIKRFLVARYGDFILMRPPVRNDTALLWFGPALVLLFGGSIAAITILRARKRSRDPMRSAASLSE